MLRHFPKPLKAARPLLQLRTFLSAAHQLPEVWNTRLSSPLLQKVSVENFYFELEQKYGQKGTISAIDVDIFANRATNEAQVDELADLLTKLRKTQEASSMLDSTGHAFVRLLLDTNQIDYLIQVLDNRLAYGVFLDDYLANVVLDKLIVGGRFRDAARIATIFMLQEDFSNPITRSLCLHACLKYLEAPEPFEDLKPPVVEEVTDKKKKKKEEVKVRVKFLRNPFFDDHFDLRDSQQLVGKTLLLIGKEIQGSLGFNLQLLGLSLYQKYSQAVELLESTKGQEVYRSVLEKVTAVLGEGADDFRSQVEAVGSTHKVVETDLAKEVEEMSKKAVLEHEKDEIERQKKIYSAWIEIRQKKLTEELERLDRVERIKQVEKMTEDMRLEEQKLWYFENQDEIKLKIKQSRRIYPRRWFGKRKPPRQEDVDYVPPDVDQRRNV